MPEGSVLLRREGTAILNVDDDNAARYFKSRILRQAGFEVREAATGGDALQLVKSEKPAVVLLDVNLPDIHGFEVCRRVKADPGTASIMVLHVSGTFLASENLVGGLESGADGYLTEPVEPEVLVATVNALVRLWATEEALRESDRRSRLLVKEIHHRIKNNLQVIHSLLSAANRVITDERALQVFKESMSRVRTMGLIHTCLYESKNLAEIDCGEFVERLVGHLAHAYALDRESVSLDLNCTPGVALDQETAIPCGLIINELVSNAMKYAFPEGRKGKIRVDVQLDGGNNLILRVADTGVGLPRDLDFHQTGSLGMELVTALGEQLGATMRFDAAKGAVFEIKFKKPHVPSSRAA